MIRWQYLTIFVDRDGQIFDIDLPKDDDVVVTLTVPAEDLVEKPLSTALNEVGKDGWELVGIYDTTSPGSLLRKAIFKRPEPQANSSPEGITANEENQQ